MMNNNDNHQKEEAFDFAKAMAELEEINHWFQSQEIDLDEGLAKFRRGLALIKKSRQKLADLSENERNALGQRSFELIQKYSYAQVVAAIKHETQK